MWLYASYEGSYTRSKSRKCAADPVRINDMSAISVLCYCSMLYMDALFMCSTFRPDDCEDKRLWSVLGELWSSKGLYFIASWFVV